MDTPSPAAQSHPTPPAPGWTPRNLNPSSTWLSVCLPFTLHFVVTLLNMRHAVNAVYADHKQYSFNLDFELVMCYCPQMNQTVRLIFEYLTDQASNQSASDVQTNIIWPSCSCSFLLSLACLCICSEYKVKVQTRLVEMGPRAATQAGVPQQMPARASMCHSQACMQVEPCHIEAANHTQAS